MPKQDGTRRLATDAAYDLWAKSYDGAENPMIAMAEHAMDETLPPVEGLRVVELGCGTGRNLARFVAGGAASVLGLDFSEGMLEKARGRGLERCRLRVHDVREALPEPDGSADLVVFGLVLEHVAHLEAPMAEAARLLAPGGALFVAEIHPYLSLGGTAAHFEDGGTTITMPTFAHDLSDFVRAGHAAGLALGRLDEWRPCRATEARTAKVGKHGDVPLLVSMIFER